VGGDRPLGRSQQGEGLQGHLGGAQSGTLTLATEPGRTVGFLAAIIVEPPPVSSHVADFLVPNDSAALKGGADEGTRDPLWVCPQGLLIRRRSECREAWVICSWIASRGSS
jgi:hypothetical protein